MEGILFSGQHF